MFAASRRAFFNVLIITGLCGWTNIGAHAQSDPLPSWNHDAAKKSIVDFVARVTTPGGADFVPPAERIDRNWPSHDAPRLGG